MGICPMCQGTTGDELCGECAASAEEGMKEGFAIRLADLEKERDDARLCAHVMWDWITKTKYVSDSRNEWADRWPWLKET